MEGAGDAASTALIGNAVFARRCAACTALDALAAAILHAELRGHEMIIELTSGRSRYIAKAFTTTQDMRDFVAAARRRR